MTIPFQESTRALIVAAALLAAPLVASAETVPGEEPLPVLMFSGLGTPQLDDLPLELSDEPTAPVPTPQLEITDLGTTPVAPEIETARSDRVMIQSTWSIGVFR